MKILTDTSVSSVWKYLMNSPSLYPEYCAVNFSLKKFLVQSCDPQLHFSKTKPPLVFNRKNALRVIEEIDQIIQNK